MCIRDRLCAGHSYAEGVPAILLFLKLKAMLPEIYAGCADRGNPDMAIFHYTIKIVGRSKGTVSYKHLDVYKRQVLQHLFFPYLLIPAQPEQR